MVSRLTWTSLCACNLQRATRNSLVSVQNIQGIIKPLPLFAQKEPVDQDMLDAGAAGPSVTWASDSGPFLVAWDLQADQGMAQVLLLARAAHCLQRLHEMDTARQQLAGSEEWQVGTVM